ncbi:MAG: hydantoinase/oxoprolinase family protein [Pseudomonadota bacterium]|nr:hydantoinase/oxoprolinase family protein [Pseudomonadota bacterium]
MTFRIGTDIGGTFTDLSISKDGNLIGRFKSPTTRDNLSSGVVACIELAASDIGIPIDQLLGDTDVFVHGSTVATNAVLEGKVATTGVLCTKGTKYTLWRGEGRRNNVFDFSQPPRPPLVAPRYCVELNERINSDGEIVIKLRENDVIEACDQLKNLGCDAVAISLLWSIRNATHAEIVARVVKEYWPSAAISLSSEVQPVLREYTRTSCTVLNVMLKPVVAAYLQELDRVLNLTGLKGELLVVASDGGVQPVDEIIKRPVYMLFSGPSTGPEAARLFAREEGAKDALLIDMGGTSFDVSTVIGDQVTTTRDGRINNFPTGLAAVEILTLGAGGGSIARVDGGGLLRVGPESAGAEPGPACYDRGGEQATVTDAYLALGYLLPQQFLGGRMKLSRDAAVSAINKHVAKPLKLDLENAALGILRVVNERMINGILEMTVRRGIDPRTLILVTAGGATGVAAIELARELGITKIIVPRETSVLCALGALNADLKWSNVLSLPSTAGNSADYDINKALKQLESSGTDFLDRLKVAPSRRQFELYCSARYPLQVTELEVKCPNSHLNPGDIQEIARRFHSSYQDRYSVSEPESDIELVMWRMVATGLVDPADRAELSNFENLMDSLYGSTRFYDISSRSFVEAKMADPDYMNINDTINGPALLVSADTTIVVPSGYFAKKTSGGYLSITLTNS